MLLSRKVVVEMVLIGIELKSNLYKKGVDKLMVQSLRDQILLNSEKQVANILFNVKAYILEDNVLLIRKDFIASQTMDMLFRVMLVISAVPFFIWGVSVPLFIVASLMVLWAILQTSAFNFCMFKIMIRRAGYKGSVRLL